MSEISERLAAIAGGRVHASMAADVCSASGGPGVLRCSKCGHERVNTEADVARYFRTGWPKCHDETMRWITGKELAAENA